MKAQNMQNLRTLPNPVALFLCSFGVSCDVVTREYDVATPAVDTQTGDCLLQADTSLFSCAGGGSDRKRLCPCLGS